MTGSVYSIGADVTGMMCGLAAQHSRHLLCVGSFSVPPWLSFRPVGGAALRRSRDGKPPALPEVHDCRSVVRIEQWICKRSLSVGRA